MSVWNAVRSQQMELAGTDEQGLPAMMASSSGWILLLQSCMSSREQKMTVRANKVQEMKKNKRKWESLVLLLPRHSFSSSLL